MKMDSCLFCRHMDAETLKVSKYQSKNPFRPYLTAEEKNSVYSSNGLTSYLWMFLKDHLSTSGHAQQIHSKTQATETICRFRKLTSLNMYAHL